MSDEIKEVAKKEVAAKAAEDNESPADETKDQSKQEAEESIYQKPYQNQVSVARNHPLSYYVDRSRRILRKDETLVVKGRGNTISMACTLVEVLKRQQIAVIKTVNTAMDIQSYFSPRGETRWTSPAPVIKFELVRGPLATCVSDYHQRKVIEIFEKQESTTESGVLSFALIKELDLGTNFKADESQLAGAQAFLDARKKDNALDLPDFIRYASILIHPLLKDKEFKRVLKTCYGIIDRKDDESADKSVEEDDDEVQNID